ncbi:ankyrin repeat domain-containing protein [Arthrobacter sp. H5]|uniref:ankyrin repeat domain-containing protein n=1 Tax=Arthrobacter sp. H5 TaxID=1267973 RepID=UPI0004828A77|nr:ankyrin repeat domain-containing protein [Arthrobacter sp. H5]
MSESSADNAIALAHRLFDAAREGDGVTLQKYLDAGVPVTLTNSAGDTLLMLAAYHGHAALVKDLTDRGTDVNAANDRGQTPLAGAAFKGYLDVVQVLVDAGADPDAGAPSARASAEMFGRPEILALFS